MRLTSFSMAKTIVAMLIGLAVEDGLLTSLDASAESYASKARTASAKPAAGSRVGMNSCPTQP